MNAQERPFYYVSDEHRLYAETQAGSGVFSLIYAGDVLACDWNFDANIIALLCPDDARTGQLFRTDARKNMVRLFKIVRDEVADLVDEVETAVATCVMWVGDRHVVCSNPDGVTTVFELKAGRLKLSVQDGGSYPFRALQGLGIVNREAQSVTIWDLHKDKVIAKEALPNRRAKKGKTRAVCSTCSSGNFSFVVNNDATFHAAYGVGRTFTVLKPMISIFSPDTRRPKANESLAPPVRSLISCALSASQVLVAAPGLSDIYRLRYGKKEQTLTVVDKARVDDRDTILALKKDRCLVKRALDGSVTYVVVALKFELLSERKKGHSAGMGEPASTEPASHKTERGAAACNDETPSTERRTDRAPRESAPASHNRGARLTTAMAVGALIVGAAIAIRRMTSTGR